MYAVVQCEYFCNNLAISPTSSLMASEQVDDGAISTNRSHNRRKTEGSTCFTIDVTLLTG